jgi:methylmalonyl-CoA mutase, C-terminal domain
MCQRIRSLMSLAHQREVGSDQDDQPSHYRRYHPTDSQAAAVRTERSYLGRALEARRPEPQAPFAAHKLILGAGPVVRLPSVSERGASRPENKYRIVVAKPGLDGHDRGAKVVARALRDAGFEVIYTGLRQTPEQIAETAIQEDADAVGLSCHSGAHMTLFPRVIQELRERGAREVVVFAGGIIPAADVPELTELGVEKIFTPGANTGDIAAWLRERLASHVD